MPVHSVSFGGREHEVQNTLCLHVQLLQADWGIPEGKATCGPQSPGLGPGRGLLNGEWKVV